MRLSTITVPVAVGSLLLLAGCTTGSDDPTDGPATETSPGTADEATPEEGETEDDGSASGGPDCLEGTWDVDMAVLRENSIPQIEGTETSIEVTGTSSLTFDGSTVTYDYDNQNSRVTVSLPEQPAMEIGVEVDGVATGTFTATDSEIEVSELDISGLTMRSTTVIDGAEVETPGLEDAEASGVPLGGTSSYTCDGDELRITPQVEGVDTSGFEQLLHRR